MKTWLRAYLEGCTAAISLPAVCSGCTGSVPLTRHVKHLEARCALPQNMQETLLKIRWLMSKLCHCGNISLVKQREGGTTPLGFGEPRGTQRVLCSSRTGSEPCSHTHGHVAVKYSPERVAGTDGACRNLGWFFRLAFGSSLGESLYPHSPQPFCRSLP